MAHELESCLIGIVRFVADHIDLVMHLALWHMLAKLLAYVDAMQTNARSNLRPRLASYFMTDTANSAIR